MGKKKPFIDKKTAVTFRLLHRSQKDPLVTDEKAPQHVLQQLDGSKSKEKSSKKDLHKYGIYYDDDYDYMQHLKETTGEGELVMMPTPQTQIPKSKPEKGINLPSSVFQSDVEEKVGVLSRNLPRSGINLDLDPDIVEAMDSDYDFSDPENELEDDFMQLANGTEVKDAEDSDDEGRESQSDDDTSSEHHTDEERDELMSLEREETKSRFTDYSMSSSVMRRTEHLAILDDKFEEMFAEYDDDEIGALDTEEIEGDADEKILDRFIQDLNVVNTKDQLTTERTVLYEGNASGSEEDEEEYEYLEVKPKEMWDCESILSKNSTAYNHPKLIEAPPSRIRVNCKGIPINESRLTAGALAKLDLESDVRSAGPKSIVSAVSLLSLRSKDESPSEKKNRKRAFREYKRERRIERKLNTLAFKEEKKTLEKMLAHNKTRFQVPL